MSARKSMTVRSYLHSSRKRAETVALLDSGATENFMNLSYAQWLGLPIKQLDRPRPVYNVDGSPNRQGQLKFFTDLQVQTGTRRTNMRFFLTDLGEHKIILGYPWFAAKQPKIDWAKGWIDHSQLPIIIRSPDAGRARFLPRTQIKSTRKEEPMFIARVEWREPPSMTQGPMSRTSTFCRTDYVRGIQLPDSDCLCFEGFNPLYGIWFSGSQYGTSISRLYAYKGCSIDD